MKRCELKRSNSDTTFLFDKVYLDNLNVNLAKIECLSEINFKSINNLIQKKTSFWNDTQIPLQI
jgi:hypothetical protein